MPSVEEPAVGKPSGQAPTLDLHEIQATVLRQRPAPYFGTHALLHVDDARAGRELGVEGLSERPHRSMSRCFVIELRVEDG